MAKIKTEAAFDKLSPEDQLKATHHPANRDLMSCLRSMLMHHTPMSRLTNDERIKLLRCAFPESSITV